MRQTSPLRDAESVGPDADIKHTQWSWSKNSQNLLQIESELIVKSSSKIHILEDGRNQSPDLYWLEGHSVVIFDLGSCGRTEYSGLP